MPLAYHHHMGTVIETQQDTERLLENTSDQVKLIIDTGHMLFAGGNFIEVVNNFKERIIHVHCKDMRKNVLEKSLKEDFSFRQAFLEGAFTVPGDGFVDYEPLLTFLKKNNYKLTVVGIQHRVIYIRSKKMVQRLRRQRRIRSTYAKLGRTRRKLRL